jgi:hypothetical protein
MGYTATSKGADRFSSPVKHVTLPFSSLNWSHAGRRQTLSKGVQLDFVSLLIRPGHISVDLFTIFGQVLPSMGNDLGETAWITAKLKLRYDSVCIKFCKVATLCGIVFSLWSGWFVVWPQCVWQRYNCQSRPSEQIALARAGVSRWMRAPRPRLFARHNWHRRRGPSAAPQRPSIHCPMNRRFSKNTRGVRVCV